MSLYKIMQTLTDEGSLSVHLTGLLNEPISDASIEISFTGDPDNIIEDISTDENGISESVVLPAPPVSNSLAPDIVEPYSEYNIIIRKNGYLPQSINGVNIFSGIESYLPITLFKEGSRTSQVSIIGPNTLYGNYPSKIPESEIKPITNSGEIVLQSVIVPETVVVHDGVPTDSTATNYYVPFPDYIKNVACSEIYPTWPEETIKANVYAIISFTLNRVYTEW